MSQEEESIHGSSSSGSIPQCASEADEFAADATSPRPSSHRGVKQLQPHMNSNEIKNDSMQQDRRLIYEAITQTAHPEEIIQNTVAVHQQKTGSGEKKRKYQDWDGDGYDGYMRMKNQKLREQFSNDFGRSSSNERRLFRGVTIWVDGATKPSREELRSIVGEHGGNFETYLTPGVVTHIVANQLAHATMIRLQKMILSKRACVVKPAWIPDSVIAGRLLPVAQYAVKGMTDPSQKSISHFFGKPKNLK